MKEDIDGCNYTGDSQYRCGCTPTRYFVWGDEYGPEDIIARCRKHLPGKQGTGEYELHFKIISKEEAIVLGILNS